MSLQLEDHVFTILEHQKRLESFLGEYTWRFDMQQGEVAFTHKGGGSIASCPVQILGTEGYEAGTWMWAWANEKSGIPEHLLTGVRAVRAEGGRAGLADFTTAELKLSKNLGSKLAVICAGHLGHFAYFACPYQGGCMYVTIPTSPLSEEVKRDIITVMSVIRMGISSYAFDHRRALISYLGEPAPVVEGNALQWDFPEGGLRVILDEQGRISKFMTNMKKTE